MCFYKPASHVQIQVKLFRRRKNMRKKRTKAVLSFIAAAALTLNAGPVLAQDNPTVEMIEEEGVGAGQGFSDVIDEHVYYYAPVGWAVEKGITSGTNEHLFSPGRKCTRAQIVTFLYKWKNGNGTTSVQGTNPFSDVSEDAYYRDPVVWAVTQGITSGVTASKFGAFEGCTRGQAVTFLWRAAGAPETAAADTFSDVSSENYFAQAVAWAVEHDITKGTGASTFSPEKACTRGQIVTFLYNADKISGEEQKASKKEEAEPLDNGYMSLEQAGKRLKERIHARDESEFNFDVVFPETSVGGADAAKTILTMLLQEASKPTGDYLEGSSIMNNLNSRIYYNIEKSERKNGKLYVKYRIHGQQYRTTLAQEEELKTKVESIVKELGIDQMTSDGQKAQAIYHYVCANTVYDISEGSLAQTAYGALCHDEAVCAGYAMAVYDLMIRAGVPCRFIAGKAGNIRANDLVAHAWNIVQIGGKWYYCDPTWDADFVQHSAAPEFYLVGSSKMADGHILDLEDTLLYNADFTTSWVETGDYPA